MPAGTYTATFAWIEPGLVMKDKLKGKFTAPKKSKHKINVEELSEDEGEAVEPVDIGTIELSSK